MQLFDPIVVWTAACIGTLFTGDPCFGLVLAMTIYCVLSFPMGSALFATEPGENWDNVTRMFYFATYGAGTALSLVWALNTPTAIPSHPVDASTTPVRRKFGIYTLMLSTVFLTKNVLWFSGVYTPIDGSFGTAAKGLPIELVYVLVFVFGVLSLVFIGLVHRDTLAGNVESTLAMTRYGAEPWDRDAGLATMAYVWLLTALVAVQALWAVDTELAWLIVLTTEAVILTAAYILFRASSRGITRRLFSRKAEKSGIRWHQFVVLIGIVTIGVGALYAGLVGTVITTFANIDWLLWSLFLGSALFAKLYPA
jgi:hypothetical protein